MEVSVVEAWDPALPDLLVRIAQKRLEGPVQDGCEETPVDVLYDVLGKPVPNEDALYFARSELDRLSRSGSELAYEVVEQLIGGSSIYDTRVSEALAMDGINIEMVDGRFWPLDEVAAELDVLDAGAGVTWKLIGKWAPAKAQWEASQTAVAQRRWSAVIAEAANALEGVVKVASTKKNISDGTKALFAAERASLGSAINQLHNYASAMPGARQGAARHSTLTEFEARGVHQAAGVFMAMIINLSERGELG
jgi:hypothetical protein